MKKEDCKTCGGCGIILVSCPTCKKKESITCPTCYGQGQVAEECPTCKGMGEKGEKIKLLNAKEIQILIEMNNGMDSISAIYEKLHLKMEKENEAHESGEKLKYNKYIIGDGSDFHFQNNGFSSKKYICYQIEPLGKKFLKNNGLI